MSDYDCKEALKYVITLCAIKGKETIERLEMKESSMSINFSIAKRKHVHVAKFKENQMGKRVQCYGNAILMELYMRYKTLYDQSKHMKEDIV